MLIAVKNEKMKVLLSFLDLCLFDPDMMTGISGENTNVV